ncbi:MAG: hypothetical protein HY519_01890, partial [Candidatus Aenigmarchaeota archaeon]|nr:hypothetical protein [Candidatus Aenigmarchaeota archaeon]
NGTIDEVRIWNRALTQAEIGQAMNQTFVPKDFFISGNATAFASATDKSGNSASNSTAFSVPPGPAINISVFDQGLNPQALFLGAATVRIRANISVPDGHATVAEARIAVKYPNGTVAVTNAQMVNVSSITNGATFEYNYTLTNTAAGTWTVTIQTNDTDGHVGRNTTNFASAAIPELSGLVLVSQTGALAPVAQQGQQVAIMANVTDADGGADLDYAYGNISYPNGTLAQNAFFTPIENISNGYTIRYAGPSDGLVLALSFEEGAGNRTIDWSNYTNNGSLGDMEGGQPTWNASGKFGKGLTFDAADDFTNVSHHSSLNLASNFTVALWVYWKGGAANQWLVGKGNDDQIFSDNYDLYLASGTQLRFAVGNGASSQAFSTSAFTKNRWHHVAVVANQSDVSIYVNGVLNTSATLTVTPATNAQSLTIGAKASAAGMQNFFNGSVDEIRIYNRALTATEVRQAANQSFKSTDFGSDKGNWLAGINVTDSRANSGFAVIAFAVPLVSIGEMAVFNSTGHKATFIASGDNATFRLNATGPTAATEIAHVYGNLTYPNGTVAQRIFYTPVNNQTANGYEFQYAGPSDGLVLAYSFEEGIGNSTNDWSNLTNNGTLVNFTCVTLGCNETGGWNASGRFGQGMLLDGADDYLNVSDNPVFDFSGSFTLAAWIKKSSFGTNGQVVVARRINETPLALYALSVHGLFANNQSKAIFGIRNASGENPLQIASLTSVADGNWHHIAGVRNIAQTRLEIYVDGTLEATIADNVTGSISQGVFTVGKQNSGGGSFFNGSIDEVRTWNRALSQLEIRQALNQSFQPTGSSGTWLVQANATDKSGNVGIASGNFTFGDEGSPSNFQFVDPTPADAANLSQTSIFVNVTFTELNPDTCTFEIVGTSPANATNSSAGSGNSRICSHNRTGLSDGSYSIKVYANDTSGNLGASDARTVVLDTSRPNVTLSINYPGGQTAIAAGQNVTLAAMISDAGSGLFNATANASTLGCGVLQLVANGSSYTAICTVAASSGAKTVYFNATDFASNENGTENASVIVDNETPANLNFTSPTPADNQSLEQSYIDINVTYSDDNPSGCTFDVDGSNYSAAYATANGSNRYCYLRVSSLSAGTHTFKAYVNDSAGHLNATENRTMQLTASASSSGSSPSGSGGGGSGAGGGSAGKEISGKLSISVGQIYEVLQASESKSLAIKVVGKANANVTVTAKGLIATFVTIGLPAFAIKGNESREVGIGIAVPGGTEPGKYEGSIEITAGNETRSIPLTLEVKASVAPQLALRLQERRVPAGGKLRYSLLITGRQEGATATITESVTRVGSGQEAYSTESELAVAAEASREIDVSGMQPGAYSLSVRLLADGMELSATEPFSVAEGQAVEVGAGVDIVPVAAGTAVLALAAVAVRAYRKRKNAEWEKILEAAAAQQWSAVGK